MQEAVRAALAAAEARMRKTAIILLLLSFLLCTSCAVDAKYPSKVVITANGKKYHRPKCHMAKKHVRTLTVEEAKKLGYEPCRVCKP